MTKPEDCDILVLPHKFDQYNFTRDNSFIILNELSKKLNKKLFCSHIVDEGPGDSNLNLPTNVILARSSMYKSKQKINEISIPTAIVPYFKNNYLKNPKLSIGFCGQLCVDREKHLKTLINSNLETNFIIRKGFFAPEIDKTQARKEFFKNMEDNLFNFCYRGKGNFSYRFYETLMMGRIPILLDSDCVFPFEDKYDINDICVLVTEENMIEKIKIYYDTNKNNLEKIQKENRKFWEKYYSPKGFVENFIDLINSSK